MPGLLNEPSSCEAVSKIPNFVCCSKDESDWAESQVLKVSDCSRLVVSLGGNNNEAIHRTLSQSRAVIIFENIKELELSNFDISHTPTDSNKRGQIASIIFRCFQFSSFESPPTIPADISRNVVISDSRYDIKIQDKTEVELNNVTFTNPVYLDVFNRDLNIIQPTLKIINSKFPAKVDIVKDGINPGSFNKANSVG